MRMGLVNNRYLKVYWCCYYVYLDFDFIIFLIGEIMRIKVVLERFYLNDCIWSFICIMMGNMLSEDEILKYSVLVIAGFIYFFFLVMWFFFSLFCCMFIKGRYGGVSG